MSEWAVFDDYDDEYLLWARLLLRLREAQVAQNTVRL